MLKLKTFLRETKLSDSTSLVLRITDKKYGGFLECFYSTRDVGVPITDAITGEEVDQDLTPFCLIYGNTPTTERLLNMRVSFCCVNRSLDAFDITLVK